MIRRHPGCVSSCGGTACLPEHQPRGVGDAKTARPGAWPLQSSPAPLATSCPVRASIVAIAGRTVLPRAWQCPGQEGPAPAPFRRRMTCTPPGGSRTRVACSARITKPADLRTLQHAFNTGALNSGALRDHGSRIANRSRHHMRYDRATALDRHVTTSLSPHRRHSRGSAGAVGHALAAYRSG